MSELSCFTGGEGMKFPGQQKKGGHPGIGSNRCIAGENRESFRAFGLAKESITIFAGRREHGGGQVGSLGTLKLLVCHHLKLRRYPEVNRESLESFNQECDGTEFAFLKDLLGSHAENSLIGSRNDDRGSG